MNMTFRAQCEARLAAGEWSGDAQVAAEIGCSISTAMSARQRWRRENGKRHENASGILPADVVDLIFFARDVEGASWRLVTKAIGEIYGLEVTANRCGAVYRRGGYKKPGPSPNIDCLGAYTWGLNVLVPQYQFPLATSNGMMYAAPVEMPYVAGNTAKYKTNCDFCPYRDWCQSHPGWLARCETARECEVME